MNNTRKIKIGNVFIGGDSPVVVQSMLNCDPSDASANLNQIYELDHAGCEIVRMTLPSKSSVSAFAEVCKKSPLPVVADIHFSDELAIAAIKSGADKIRINPGNLGGLSKCDKIIDIAKQHDVAIRIGVNAGSLDEKQAARTDIDLSEKLAISAKEYVDYFEERGFNDLVVSAKAHDVQTTIKAYEILHESLPDIPLHIGITEAGTKMQGAIKSAAGLGILLQQGIGDTLRISLTDNPVEEVRAAWMLLSALNIRRRGVEIISCPTCGRTKVDLIPIAKQVEEALSDVSKPIKVAVMGCVVNGPGEAKDADIGVACGNGDGAIFVKGDIIRKVKEDEILIALLDEISKL